MERLWAPWRAQYIREGALGGDAGCFLCRGIAGPAEADRENLVVWRRPDSVVFLNKFPYNNGHLLVAPRDHLGSFGGLEGRALVEPVETIQTLIAVLDRMMRPQGYNVGLNLGKTAGAGLPGHLHWHVVPRWDGDANFMPVVAQTKVLIESLEDFYDRLHAALHAEGG